MSIRDETTQELSRRVATSTDALIITGLTKFLGRPVTEAEALVMGARGRLSSKAFVGRPDDRTYCLDGEPFLFVGALEMRSEQSEGGLSYRLIVSIPHQFIPRSLPTA